MHMPCLWAVHSQSESALWAVAYLGPCLPGTMQAVPFTLVMWHQGLRADNHLWVSPPVKPLNHYILVWKAGCLR